MTGKHDDSLLFKQLEWELDLDTNTLYLPTEIDQIELVSFINKINALIQRNGTLVDINLIISSSGGDGDAMLGIIDHIRSLPVKVNTKCIGGAYSAAAVILACGTGKRSMTKYSSIMLHEGISIGSGKISDMITGVDHLKVLTNHVNTLLGEVTKKNKKYWDSVLKTDLYLTAEEALKLGIVDEIT